LGGAAARSQAEGSQSQRANDIPEGSMKKLTPQNREREDGKEITPNRGKEPFGD